MTIRLVAVAAMALACTAPTPTTPPTPTSAPTQSAQPTPTATPGVVVNPPICADATFVFDWPESRLLLVTCVDQLDPANHEQIWSWDGTAWTLVDDSGPPPVVVTAVAWDSDRRVLVRYGGLPMNSNDCVAETWEWDRTGWTQRATADDPHPPACDHMKMTYDAARQMTVMVGGGHLQDLSPETWGWDGSSWTKLADTGPAPRAHHAFTYSEPDQLSLLYGGIDNTSIFEDAWAWDGQTWTELELGGPGSRSHVSFAESSNMHSNGLFMFGGATGQSTFGSLTDETWILGGGEWEQIDAQGPSPRGSAAIGGPLGRFVNVLYGGFDETGAELGDTWEFDGYAWRCVSRC